MTQEEKTDWLYRIKSEIMYRMPTDWATPMYEVFTEALEAFRKSQKEPCEDAISRKHFDERIRTVAGMVWDELSEDYKGAVCAILEMLKTEPSVQPQTEPSKIKCNSDTIKQLRGMVADINCEEIFAHDDVTMPMWTSAWRERMFDLIDELPSVTAERKTAKWIDIVGGNGKTVLACRCTKCGNSPKHALKTSYCPNCGAKMEVE